MKFSKSNLSYILISLLISSSLIEINSSKIGAQMLLSQNVINNSVQKFASDIVDELNKVKIPDQQFKVNAGIGTLKVNIKDTKIVFKSFPVDKLIVNFAEPNAIQVSVSNVNLNGSFKAQLKLGFIKDTLPTTFKIKNLKLNTIIVLGKEPSKADKTKFIPSADVSKFDIDFDLDFEIHTKIIGNLVKLVKSLIKDKIKKAIKDAVSSSIKSNIKDQVSKEMNKLILTPEIYEGISLNFSLLDDPLVKNSALILNTKGQLYDTNYPKTLNPPFDLVEIDDKIGTLNKDIEVIVSEYVINTAIYTFILSDKLNIEITNKDIPKESPLHLTTTSLNTILAGVEDKYGKDKEMYLKLKGSEPVKGVSLTNGKINAEAASICEFYVVGVEETVATVEIIISTEVNVELKDNAELKVSIKSATIKDLKIIETKLPKMQVKTTKFFLNIALTVAIPMINKKVLDNIKLDFPTYMGIKFTSSQMVVHENYIEVGVTPEFKYLKHIINLDNMRMNKFLSNYDNDLEADNEEFLCEDLDNIDIDDYKEEDFVEEHFELTEEILNYLE